MGRLGPGGRGGAAPGGAAPGPGLPYRADPGGAPYPAASGGWPGSASAGPSAQAPARPRGGAGGGGRGNARQRERRNKRGGRGRGGADEAVLAEEEEQDRRYFAEVCYSLMAYNDDATSELSAIEDTYRGVTDPMDQALLPTWNTYPKMYAEMKVAARINAHFLAGLVTSDESAQEFVEIPRSHQVQDSNASKTRTVLRQFVRDWSAEGQMERDSQYGVLLKALQQHMPLPEGGVPADQEPPRVLCPGSGLSRLPFEVARLGYSAQGNEFSYHMLQGSKWVLNETSSTLTHTIFPFVLSLEHRKRGRSQLQAIKIPDVCPAMELNPDRIMSRPQDFSMSAGEFVEVYQPQVREWDSVLTCFFLDTANNVFLYIRTIALILRPGGLWANLGPLLYHYAESPRSVSIELSWEEVKPAIQRYFDFKEEEVREAYYTTNADGLFHTRYRCIFFTATRNNTPPEGRSKPVFS